MHISEDKHTVFHRNKAMEDEIRRSLPVPKVGASLAIIDQLNQTMKD